MSKKILLAIESGLFLSVIIGIILQMISSILVILTPLQHNSFINYMTWSPGIFLRIALISIIIGVLVALIKDEKYNSYLLKFIISSTKIFFSFIGMYIIMEILRIKIMEKFYFIQIGTLYGLSVGIFFVISTALKRTNRK